MRTFDNTHTVAWQRSEAGEGHVFVCSCIRDKVSVCQPRLGIDPKEQTVWELPNRLRAQGWVAGAWDDTAHDPDPINVLKCAPKVLYIRPHYVTLARTSLEALVTIAEIRKRCHTSIKYFQRGRYYKNLLKEKRAGQMRPDIGFGGLDVWGAAIVNGTKGTAPR